MSTPSVNGFSNLSNAIAGTVATAGNSIVTVRGRRRRPASGIVYAAEGLIVTANHVVERDENLSVVLPSGEEATAELVGRDPAIDLALLRVENTGLTAAAWAEPAEVQTGHLVLAVGRPNGAPQVSMGILTSVNGPWQHRGGGQFDLYIQADIIMYPGFSGGALVLASGTFAGLNSSALARGVSLAVPASNVRTSVEALLAHGHIPRAWLGVGVQKVNLQADSSAERAASTGLMIMSVEQESPAASGGMLQGDILLALNEHELGEIEDLQLILASITAPTNVQAQVLRGGKVQTFPIALNVR